MWFICAAADIIFAVSTVYKRKMMLALSVERGNERRKKRTRERSDMTSVNLSVAAMC